MCMVYVECNFVYAKFILGVIVNDFCIHSGWLDWAQMNCP